MSEALQNLVVEPDELRKLDTEFEAAWMLVQSGMDEPLQSEDEGRFRLAKIMIDLIAERTEQQDLASKAAARWLEGR